VVALHIQLRPHKDHYAVMDPLLGQTRQRLVVGNNNIAQAGGSGMSGHFSDRTGAVGIKGVDMDITPICKH